MATTAGTAGISVQGARVERQDEVLTPEALTFLAELQRRFGTRRRELLARRQEPRAEAGRSGAGRPHRPAGRDHRPDRAQDAGQRHEFRRPGVAGRLRGRQRAHLGHMIGGQANLTDAIERRIDFTTPVGLYFFHNAARQLAKGSGPYFYLPKLESHREARLWNDVFVFAQDALGIPPGTVRATTLIETIPAAFEMEEILHELRDHASGLSAGRWDYMFSLIKTFRERPEFVLPDRNSVTMTVPFMRAYTELLVRTCHRRGAFAIGGMAAFIPSRRDPEVNAAALEKVRQDKEREAGDDVQLGADQLLDLASTPGEITEAGLRANVEVGLRYIASWLVDTGAAAIHNLMEDVATAEISRSQAWRWVHNAVRTSSGRQVDADLVRRVLGEELARLRGELGEQAFRAGRFEEAGEVFEQVALADEFVEFLTLPAYGLLDQGR